MKLKDIRRHNLSLLVSQFETIAAVADLAGTSEKYLSQIINQTLQGDTARGLGDAVAAKLERGCNKPEGWMDQDHQAVGHDESPVKPLVERIIAMTWDDRRLKLLAGFLDLLEASPPQPPHPTRQLKRARIGQTPLKKPPRKLP